MTNKELREKAEYHALAAEKVLETWPRVDSKNASIRATAHASLSIAFFNLLYEWGSDG